MMQGDVVRREALIELANNHADHKIDANDIARVPAVDAVPVVHGEWMYKDDGLDSLYECSVCGYCNFHYARNHFCTNCGAKMDGGTHEQNP